MITKASIRVALGAFCSLITLAMSAREAAAQTIADSHCPNLSGEKNGGLDWMRPPIRNTVGYRTMTNALLSNAQAYGAVTMTERRLIPLLAADDGKSPDEKSKGVRKVLDLDTVFTFGAVSLPLCPQNRGDKPITGSVDLSVVNMGFGARYSFFGVFLASSVAAHTIFTSQSASKDAIGRGTVALTLPMMAISYFPAGLIKSEYYRENLSVVYTHVAGAAIFTPIGPITAGYATTRGFFTNFTGSMIPIFASALLASKLEEVPYLSAGLATIAPLAPKSWLLGAGDTSLYARRLQYIGLAPTGVSTRQLGDSAVSRTQFVTQHLEQSGIGRIFDVTIVTTTSPQPNLYEATLGVHTPGYRSPRAMLATVSGGGGENGGKAAFGVSVSAGVVRLPNLWFYGVEGGYRFKASVNVGGIDANGVISFGLAVNDTDILSVFPYAYNAPQLSAMIAGAF